MKTFTIVITSISPPNNILHDWAISTHQNNHNLIIVGDSKSPDELGSIEHCDYYSINRQLGTGLKSAEHCPTNHYSRKNIGYLLAIKKGIKKIVETDDDNLFYPGFWEDRSQSQSVRIIDNLGCINIYKYFTNDEIWPRGLPLSKIKSDPPPYNSLEMSSIDCPIQQGLVDGDPDVDAIFRLTRANINQFRFKRKIALSNFTYCPFNSQNTTWFHTAFPLLYLPSSCSFRMTDIWRSFVAQRIAWENEWGILFHEPTVFQMRNKHDIMKDFIQEIPGYINNEKILDELSNLNLKEGLNHLGENLLICYEKLVALNLVGREELNILSAWLKDLEQLSELK